MIPKFTPPGETESFRIRFDESSKRLLSFPIGASKEQIIAVMTAYIQERYQYIQQLEAENDHLRKVNEIASEALEQDRDTFDAMKRVVKVLVDNGVVIDGNALVQDCENALFQQEKALFEIRSLPKPPSPSPQP